MVFFLAPSGFVAEDLCGVVIVFRHSTSLNKPSAPDITGSQQLENSINICFSFVLESLDQLPVLYGVVAEKTSSRRILSFADVVSERPAAQTAPVSVDPLGIGRGRPREDAVPGTSRHVVHHVVHLD